MVYHDASREGVISCWPQDAEPPLRQSITPPRSSGTVTIPETRPHHPGLGSNPTSSPCRRSDPVEASSPSAPLPLPRRGHPECPPTTDTQVQTLREMKRSGGILWRAYQLKEALREVFAGDLDAATVTELLDRWCARAQRSRIPEFIKAGRTIRKHRAGIDAAIDRGLSNGRHEGLNTKVRLLIRRAYGFHSARAALALILLACGPVTLKLPYHTAGHPHSWQ
jgi:hypothetical protein